MKKFKASNKFKPVGAAWYFISKQKQEYPPPKQSKKWKENVENV